MEEKLELLKILPRREALSVRNGKRDFFNLLQKYNLERMEKFKEGNERVIDASKEPSSQQSVGDIEREESSVNEGSRGKHYCRDCGQIFNYACYLKSHCREYEAEKLLECDICGEYFAYASVLRTHVDLHQIPIPAVRDTSVMEIPVESTSDRSDEGTHLREYEAAKSLECGICGEPFASESALWTHADLHLHTSPIPIFDYASYLKSHRREYEAEKPFLCGYCDERFASVSDFTTHVDIHGIPAVRHTRVMKIPVESISDP